ncbi:MAG: HAMP domain-containing protein [Anaerolineales bacterium]|nr:MAG: HAMP domain-containing protein [Anaerolineales bacterium]
MSLRLRLTMLYTAVLAAVLILFGTIVYTSLNFSLTSEIEQTLNRTADEVLAAGRLPDDLAITLRALDLTTNVYVQFLSVSGELLWQSNNAPILQGPFDQDTLSALENVYTTKQIEVERLRVLTVPLVSRPDNEVVGYLQLASTLNTVDFTTRMLFSVLITGGVLAMIVAAIIGYMAAGAALKPLDQVTATALQITRADDLSRRIPLLGPPTGEVGQLIQAFNETLERLDNLFQAQRRFLADVSHELRTPLTAIRGNVDLIRQFGSGDEESLEAIGSEVERMTRMVQDLLILAQAETGKLPLAQEAVELDTLMLEVYRQGKVLSRDKLQIKIGREDQARVKGDRDRLKQVLLNLVANAIEHTPSGGLIQLDLVCQGDHAELRVSDNGPGIPEDDLPHIFERFFRRDPSRSRRTGGGAGLGLSIAFWITRSHGGTIKVESKEGQGSTFTIILPLLIPEANQNPLPK